MPDGLTANRIMALSGLTALALMVLCCTGPALAADRVVIAECFIDENCGYSHYARVALNRLLNENPETFTALQIHVHDDHVTTWGDQRADFYGVVGTPVTWFDGMIERLGVYTDENEMWSWYDGARAERAAVPTDVSITLSAVETTAPTYEVTATVRIDADGTGKSLQVHVVQVLDNFPSGIGNRNCVMAHQDGGVHNLAPGDSVDIVRTFTLNAESWLNITEVKFVAFAREPGTTAPKEVYQAAEMPWPFEGPQIVGDMDGDGDVDLSDLAALIATYGLCDGDEYYDDAADFVDDDCIDLADLAALLGNYGYGVP